MARPGGDTRKKLKRLARRWASGRASKQDNAFADECRRKGLDPAAFGHKPEGDDAVDVWPCMSDAVLLFFAASTQWRMVAAGPMLLRTGLEYAVLPSIAATMRLTLDEATFADLRTLEAEALSAFNRR